MGIGGLGILSFEERFPSKRPVFGGDRYRICAHVSLDYYDDHREDPLYTAQIAGNVIYGKNRNLIL